MSTGVMTAVAVICVVGVFPRGLLELLKDKLAGFVNPRQWHKGQACHRVENSRGEEVGKAAFEQRHIRFAHGSVPRKNRGITLRGHEQSPMGKG